LRHHGQIARLIVGREERARIVALVDVFPAAAVRRLQKDRKAEVLEDVVPVDETQVAKDFAPRCSAAGALCGSSIVRGVATPTDAATMFPKYLSSADHQNGLLTTCTPRAAAALRNVR
jgi:hypothetical protein